MLNLRITCFALSFSFLLFMSGCFNLEEDTLPADSLTRSINSFTDQLDLLTSCTSICEQQFLHSTGSIKNGTCTCLCEKGYQRYNGTCINLQEYNEPPPVDPISSCTSACEQKFPHSVGSIKNGICTCPCEKGYVSYNKTCISPNDFENLAPVLCSKKFPVLKIYDWKYKGEGNYVYLCYEDTRKEDVSENRSARRDYWNFVGDPYSNSTISLVTDLLMNISNREGFSKYEQIKFVISFVQGLPYTYDNVTTPYDNYPRFPSETIYMDGGDCEDTAILLAAILKKMGYDVVLFGLPRHVAIGVYCNPSDFDYTVASYPYNGRDYCYIETASGQNWEIGMLPKPYVGVGVEIIPLRSAQPDIYLGWGQANKFHYTYTYDSRDTYVDVTRIRIDNFGTVPAKNVKLYVALETTEDGKVWDQYTHPIGDLRIRGYVVNSEVTNLHAPTGKSFRVSVIIYGDNFESIESKGGWVTWN